MATASPRRSESVTRRPPGGSILLNGQRSPSKSPPVPQPIKIPPQRTPSSASTDQSLSPAMSSPETSATSGEETAPLKLRFSTPLPSGKKRSSSITLGVAARAQLLSAQNGGAPVQRQSTPQFIEAQVAEHRALPMGHPMSPMTIPTDVYTVADAKAGLKKAWSKVKRKKRGDSTASSTSSASVVTVDSSASDAPAEEEVQEVPQTKSGEATPRRRASPGPEELDTTAGLTRRATADEVTPIGRSKLDVLGFEPPESPAEPERTHEHEKEYKTELWRGRQPSNGGGEDGSSTVSDQESRKSSEDDVEDVAEQMAMMSRKTSNAAGYELVERQKRA